MLDETGPSGFLWQFAIENGQVVRESSVFFFWWSRILRFSSLQCECMWGYPVQYSNPVRRRETCFQDRTLVMFDDISFIISRFLTFRSFGGLVWREIAGFSSQNSTTTLCDLIGFSWVGTREHALSEYAPTHTINFVRFCWGIWNYAASSAAILILG